MFGRLFARDYQSWQLPEFNIMDAHHLVQAVQERPAFIRADDVLGGAGTEGRYVFFESSRDALFVFRFPLTNFMNVYVHERGSDGLFGRDDGIKAASVSVSGYKPEEHDVTYVECGWWIDHLNGLFRYLIDVSSQEHSGQLSDDHYAYLRRLEQASAAKENDLADMFRR
ncbi:hypothetical protein [Alkalicoccus urumqiensis]|uniref:Uncharacterized protein n=1 Tax=Alkalicoccus urumqiensis TaxID=1548213 RepID=A0A2P6MJV0_ALKUR|nr:hypothetical protein [Alkalicoccus urumqiensis]PRO66543.1 hypothetical protein C6I21_04150 [Alkalicoccus urumqiensis]